jgi:hypothetical protein
MIYIDRLQVTTTATYVFFPLSTITYLSLIQLTVVVANSPAGPAPMTNHLRRCNISMVNNGVFFKSSLQIDLHFRLIIIAL